MNKKFLRGGAVVALSALAFSALPISALQAQAVQYQACSDSTTPLTVFTFNDFHGRIMNAAAQFSPVVDLRAAQGADNVVLISNGDNIGGSTFESASQDDNPTVKILNAIGIDATSAGNHEFDKGWADLQKRQDGKDSEDGNPVDFVAPILAANVYTKGTTEIPSPLKAYTIVEKAGVKVAIVGAVTPDLPSLVSPEGIKNLDIVDPVDPLNAIAKQLRETGEADLVIAAVHDGAPSSSSAEDNLTSDTVFSRMYNEFTGFDLVVNGHTHQTYTWTTKDGAPLIQAGSYGEKLGKVNFTIDNAAKKVCGTPTAEIVAKPKNPSETDPIPALTEIANDAKNQADVIGQEVIGKADTDITLPGNKQGNRDRESVMNNMVAEMFYDTLAGDNKEFIGVQNPGGTRTELMKGDVTYKDAALVLPFANSLMTTELTGEQVKTMLEQQWQRDDKGNVPTRAFLRLGLSKNIRYTYDESRKEGDRITGIWINGKPIDPAKTYTVGSGSFLIAGGDNFRVLADGKNRADTGKIDLQAFVDWVKAKSPLKPDATLRGVSVQADKTEVKAGETVKLTLGVPQGDKPVANDTLDLMTSATKTESVTVKLSDYEIGSHEVTDGQVKDWNIAVPPYVAAGDYRAEITLNPSGATFFVPVKVTSVLPRVGGTADVYLITEDGMFYHDGANADVAQMVFTKGGKADVTMLRQHNWIGGAKSDVFERNSNGQLTLQADGVGEPQVIGKNWNGINEIIPMGGGKEPAFLAARHVNGNLYGYRWDGKVLRDLGQIGKNWGSMVSIFSVGDLGTDNKTDIVAIHRDGTLWMYQGKGNGRITDGMRVGGGWGGFTAFSPGDVDGDGRKDLMGVRRSDGKVFYYKNNGRGFNAAAQKGDNFNLPFKLVG